ncbi:MAG: ABC transporter ATP-binding protein [Sphingobacteriales bacterium]|nr:MAG: ABC transporter ATP-binding protein [Sphingobacteriales bacterium]
MIEFKNVSKKYSGKAAVENVSFLVKEKENLVLLGTSGCGKTTTLKMINRLVSPDSGEIIVDGKDVNDQNPELLRRRIGYVMQNTGLFPHYSVRQNIALVPELLKWSKSKTEERTEELITKLHLNKDCLNMYPNELSGGQQQRVGLARALISDPALLLMDEPFGALDNVTRAEIQKEFKALDEFKRKTIVMVTHDVQEAFELADRIALMDKGKIIQIGTPKELLYKPTNAFSKGFFDGQRLALEFKVSRISDLWEFISGDEIADDDSFTAELSVWQAMETLRLTNKAALKFSHKNGERKSVDFNILTQAFNAYQNSHRNE